MVERLLGVFERVQGGPVVAEVRVGDGDPDVREADAQRVLPFNDSGRPAGAGGQGDWFASAF